MRGFLWAGTGRVGAAHVLYGVPRRSRVGRPEPQAKPDTPERGGARRWSMYGQEHQNSYRPVLRQTPNHGRVALRSGQPAEPPFTDWVGTAHPKNLRYRVHGQITLEKRARAVALRRYLSNTWQITRISRRPTGCTRNDSPSSTSRPSSIIGASRESSSSK